MLRDRNLNGNFEDDEIYYFTKDHLGSVREIVGLDGKIKQRQRYSAYGRTTREKNDSELSRLIDQPYGFTSREHDAETGMYYYRARYYDPSVGRFVTEDPIGFEGGDYNLYRYVLGSPQRFTDPLGLLTYSETKQVGVGVLKVFVGTAVGVGGVALGSSVASGSGGLATVAGYSIAVGGVVAGVSIAESGLKDIQNTLGLNILNDAKANELPFKPYNQFDDINSCGD